jgi:nitrogen-specific signal transduction histidine kinase
MWATMEQYLVASVGGGLGVLGVWLLVVCMRQRRELATLRAKIEKENGERMALSRLHVATRSTLDGLPHAVAIVSPDGKIDFANQLAESLFKLTPQTVHHPDWLNTLLDQVHKTSAPAVAKPFQIFDGNNQELFFRPRTAPIFDENKTIVGVLVILENATELRQVEEAKSGLLAMASHELKTPLTSIQMAIHLLIEDPRSSFSAKERELLRTAGEDAERLNVLIQRLLDKGRE